MPLPFLAAELPVGAELKGRRRQRWLRTRTAQRWVNRTVCALNFFELRPSVFHSAPVWCRRPPTPAQAHFANGLVGELRYFFRLPPDLGAVGGRGKISELVRRVSASAYGAGARTVERAAATAQPVIPDRVAVPTAAGRCDPTEQLKEPYRSIYLDPTSPYLPTSQWGHLPKPCHKIDPNIELGFAKKLVACGMGRWVMAKD